MVDGVMAGKKDKAGRPIRFLPEGIADDAVTDVQIDEAMPELAEAEILRTLRTHKSGVMEVPAGLVTRHMKALVAVNPRVANKFRVFFEAARAHFGLTMKRSVAMEKGFRDGTLDRAKYDEHLRKVLGKGEHAGEANAEVDLSRMEVGWDGAAFSATRNQKRRTQRRKEVKSDLNQKVSNAGQPLPIYEEIADFSIPEATFGWAASDDYKRTLYARYPDLEGKVWIHHAVEQKMLEENGGPIKWQEMHSIENLRGIPIDINTELHLRVIRMEWNDFYERHQGLPSRGELLKFAGPLQLPEIHLSEQALPLRRSDAGRARGV
jgi:hypothetical protein